MKINVENLLCAINAANMSEYNMRRTQAAWRRRVGPWVTLYADRPRDKEEETLIWRMNESSAYWSTVNTLSGVLGVDVMRRAAWAARALERWSEARGWVELMPADEMERLGRWVLGE